MGPYILPAGMRYASLSERESFYRSEFDLGPVKEWFHWADREWRVVFAVIMGRHTRIFPQKYAEEAGTTILIDEYGELEEVRAEILEFLPESVYYDRNMYDGKRHVVGQELAFDIDPENFECPIHGRLEDKMRVQQGLGFCELELNMARNEAIELYEQIIESFSDVCVVYSGRGFHIHILDRDAVFLSRQKRRMLARQIKAKGFHIDEWVTAGEMRLIRLPHSLHGMVSRKCLPIDAAELPSFDPLTDERCLPKFLERDPSSG